MGLVDFLTAPAIYCCLYEHLISPHVRFSTLKCSLNTTATYVFKDPGVAETWSTIHDIYVVVSADKGPKQLVRICRNHNIHCLNIESGLNS
jgi:hypothetical protein